MEAHEVKRGTIVRIVGEPDIPPESLQISKGDIVKILLYDGAYCKVETEKYQIGYIKAWTEVEELTQKNKTMKQVIRINKEEKTKDNPVVFTHYLNISSGWETSLSLYPKDYDTIVYLGRCPEDGDMFAAYSKDGTIETFKGFVNSGKY